MAELYEYEAVKTDNHTEKCQETTILLEFLSYYVFAE